jgi:hypothetical protein
MAADVIGLTLAKLNGIYEVDVLNSRWDVSRAVAVHTTAAGNRQALGVPIPSGSFDEVISRQGATDWTSLTDFRIDIYDKETKSIVVFSASGCNWEKIGGSTDEPSATTKKSIAWKGTDVNKV